MGNQTLLVETTQKIQTEQLLKCKTYFNLPVEVSEHKTLNSSKGIIRDKALKGETEENIKDYLCKSRSNCCKKIQNPKRSRSD